MNKIYILHFIKYFGLSVILFFSLLFIECIGLFWQEEFPIILKLALLSTFSEIDSIIVFSVLSGSIFTSKNQELELKKMIIIGILLSLTFGTITYLTSDKFVPYIKGNLYILRHSIAKGQMSIAESDQTRIKLLKYNFKTQSTSKIKNQIDSITVNLLAKGDEIKVIAMKIPDSILKSRFESKLDKFQLKGTRASEYNHRNNGELRSSIMSFELDKKRVLALKQEISTRILHTIMIVLLSFLGLFIGSIFKHQHWISLACIAMVIYLIIQGLSTKLLEHIRGGQNIFGVIYQSIMVIGIFIISFYKVLKRKS